MRTIPLKLARRIAIAAQGFGEAGQGSRPDRRHLRRLLARNGLLQMDSVNVLVRAHYMPMFSRLGPYDRNLIDGTARGRRRLLFEYWAHEASLLPVESWPLMRWRMERAARGERIYKGLAEMARDRPDFIEEVYRRVATDGPIAASDLEGARGKGGWWGWSETKAALEYLFWSGRITTAERRPSFERVYDLPERSLPAAVLEAPPVPEADAQRELLRISARALGVATAAELRDYFRLPPEAVKARLPELLESEDVTPVRVEGWNQPAYLATGARMPRRIEASALLSPFDPLVWERSRTERLFGFRYRIEIYTPADRRVHGYYVLPFLHREALVARVDLKADRQTGRLMVQSAFAEPGAPDDTAEALLKELRRVADWLGLDGIKIAPSGDLAPRLRELH